jgi:hypothetical protein
LNCATDNQSLAKLYYITTWWLQYLRLSTTDDWAYTSSHQVNLADWKYHTVSMIKNWTTQNLFLDWIWVWSTWNSWTGLQALYSQWIAIWKNQYDTTQRFNWVIDEVIIRNNVPSNAEQKNKYLFYNWFI